MKKVVLIGAGGHARVVASALYAMKAAGDAIELAGYVDRAEGSLQASHLGIDADLPDLKASGVATHFIIGLGSVRGGQGIRQRLFEAGLAAGLSPISIVHPSAIIDSDTAIKAGTFIAPGCIVNTGVRIAENAILNTGAIVDHDCQIGAHTHIAPGAVLSGDVLIGSDCLLGVGAVVRHGSVIGDGATIGAGATVVQAVEARSVVVGTPARQIGQ